MSVAAVLCKTFFVVSQGKLMSLCNAVARLTALHQQSFEVTSHTEEESI